MWFEVHFCSTPHIISHDQHTILYLLGMHYNTKQMYIYIPAVGFSQIPVSLSPDTTAERNVSSKLIIRL